MLDHNGLIEIGIVGATLLIGLFMMRARHSNRQSGPDKEREDFLKDEARRSRFIERDLKKIEQELTPYLDQEGLALPEQKKPQLKVIPGEKNLSVTEPVKPSVPVARESAKFITLDEALKSTKSGIMGRLRGLFSSQDQVAKSDLESIEEVLYTSDLGPQTVQRLISAVTSKMKLSETQGIEDIRNALRGEMLSILENPQQNVRSIERFFHAGEKSPNMPEVWMIVGVNGAGKTTTIGKMAYRLAISGKRVMVAAGDTFRAAAGEQLKVWSERAEVQIFAPEGVESPSAVAFDAVKYAIANDYDHLILDTAGRLHTQKNLMEELKKIKRVIAKAFKDASPEGVGAVPPHEVLLVLDANSGQNALIQAREFHQELEVTGVILTKLDGTAKGGVAVGIAEELHLPIQLIGVGESKEDLRPFQPAEFVDAIV